VEWGGRWLVRRFGHRFGLLFGQLAFAARVRIYVSAASGDEHRRRARMRPFNRLLRESRVIAAEFIKLSGQRRVVAGVTEDNSAQLSVRRFDAPTPDSANNHALP